MLRTTQTVDPIIELSPALLAQLEGNLNTYNDLKAQAALLKDAMDAEKETMRDILETNSIESLKVRDCSLRIVRGVTTTLDKKKLLGLGVTPAQIEMATVTKPRKSYLDVRGSDDVDAN